MKVVFLLNSSNTLMLEETGLGLAKTVLGLKSENILSIDH